MVNKRILKEIQSMMKDNDLKRNNYYIEVVDDSKTQLLGKVLGSDGTPFAGGVFKIDIKVPDRYPFEPPKCKFMTKVWHPNISSQTGAICLDILKGQWAAAMTIESVLISLQTFLSSPEPLDPQDAVVANQYRTDRDLYDKTAKYWTYTYALTPEQKKDIDTTEFKDFEQKIEKLRETLNISLEEALSALSCANWNIERAIASIK